MSVTVRGVPERIPRRRLLDVLAGLGFDAGELVSLTFHRGGVVAEVLASATPSGDGKARRFTADGETAATHRVCIPVTDEATGEGAT